MKNKICNFIAKRLPDRILYFCVIRSWAIVTTQRHTDKTPTEVTWDMVCNYLEDNFKKKL